MLQKLHQKSTLVVVHFIEHFAGGIRIAFFTQVLEENVVCCEAEYDFDRFEDTIEGDSFHCELVALSAVSPPSKLSFNSDTLCQDDLIAQPHLSM